MESALMIVLVAAGAACVLLARWAARTPRWDLPIREALYTAARDNERRRRGFCSLYDPGLEERLEDRLDEIAAEDRGGKG